MNRKRLLFSIIQSIVFAVFMSGTILSMSLGTQNKLLIIKEDLLNAVLKQKDSLTFLVNDSGKRVESFVNQETLETLKMSFYNYATAERLFDDNFYLSIECDGVAITNNVALLESVEKPLDSDNFILQGNLESLCSERITIDGHSTSYGFLSSSDDAIYIPEVFGKQIIDYFHFSSYEQMIYSDAEDSKMLSGVKVVLKNLLDDTFSYDCKLRGVYKNDTALSSKISLYSKNENPVLICSPNLFNSITFNENKLACIIKYNSNKQDSYYRFLDALSNCFEKHDFSIDLSTNPNEVDTSNLNRKVNQFESKHFNKNKWVYVLVATCVFLTSIFVLALLYKKHRPLRLVLSPIFLFLYIVIVFIFSLVKLPGIILVSNKSLFWSVLFMFTHVGLSALFGERIVTKRRQEPCEFFLINI